ncbi:putative disease resistance protein At4g10780 isoform X2 [Populus alba]|uniref:putative disease resistance protein At4g10780 isoform X2 n=1 Tax=Populus alba TaxID=43335 RepID=UPI00158ACE1F|nr:disease resistance protein RFL1-like isoform X2 [Populus alba]
MVVSDDEFWAHVEEMNDCSKKCVFCGHVFAIRTSISRIKWHWSGIAGHGVAICRQVPKHVQEAAFLATDGANKKLKIRANWSTEDDDDVDNKTEEALVEIVAEASSFRGRTLNKRDAREDALPIRELVGQAFEENKNAIWSWLMNDEVFCIGIYGMGGVGKTSLVKHIYYQLRRKSDTFHRVHWITVSQDFSIYKLQNHIAKCLGLHLSNEDNEMQRAQELSEALGTKRPHFLILDDLWDTFDPEKVGIPIQEDGCKLIITTRSLKVCRGMGCIHKIKVEPLTCDEAWTLFMEKLKHDVELSPEVKQIAKLVTKECAGLPLGIITMAGSMRGVDDLHEWRNTLEKLKESKVRDMEDEGFRLLRFSYDRLDDLALQQCFLYCALFPEGISRDDLIGYLIDEGIIDGIKSRQAEFDEGHTMLNELEELRDVDKWKEDLVRVSWTSGKLKEISPSHSPRTSIEVLPDSVSDLVSLRALLLKGCKQLRHVPSLKKLRPLKRLDLIDTVLENVPQDMEYLSNLRCLKLNGCRQKEFPTGILPKLSSLQVFVLDDWVNGQYAPVIVEGKELACLRKLETLECHFELFSDFVGYLKSWNKTLSLSTYKFLVGQWNNDHLAFLEFSGRSKIVWLCNFNNRSCLEFPTDIQELVILKSIDAKSLCDVLSPQYTAELEYIEIVFCDRMESLLSSSWFCSTPLPFRSNDIFSHLKDFYCYGCTSMKKLFPLVLLPNLLNLEMISVERCDKMEEIIETRVDWVMGEESSSSCRSIEFNLPKLRHLSFILLPELKSICRENLICSSLQTIIVRDCPKLKRMPLCLPVLDNGRPSPPPSLEEIYVDPKEWWESVEWDHPDSKDALLPFLVLGGGARLLEEEGDEEDVEDNDEKRF